MHVNVYVFLVVTLKVYIYSGNIQCTAIDRTCTVHVSVMYNTMQTRQCCQFHISCFFSVNFFQWFERMKWLCMMYMYLCLFSSRPILWLWQCLKWFQCTVTGHFNMRKLLLWKHLLKVELCQKCVTFIQQMLKCIISKCTKFRSKYF